MKTLTNKWYEEVRQGPSGSEDEDDEAELLWDEQRDVGDSELRWAVLTAGKRTVPLSDGLQLHDWSDSWLNEEKDRSMWDKTAWDCFV